MKLTSSGKALTGRSVMVKERKTGTTTWLAMGPAMTSAAGATATVTAAGQYRDTLTATLTSKGKAVAGVRVRLQYRDRGSGAWSWLTVTKTGTAGKASWMITQSVASREYRALFSGNASVAAVASSAVTITKA